VDARLRHVLARSCPDRADVRAAVAAISASSRTPQRHAHELAVRRGARCSGPARSCRRRRPYEAQDGAAKLVDALLNSQVLDDALTLSRP